MEAQREDIHSFLLGDCGRYTKYSIFPTSGFSGLPSHPTRFLTQVNLSEAENITYFALVTMFYMDLNTAKAHRKQKDH